MKNFRSALILSVVILALSISDILHMKRPLTNSNIQFIAITFFLVIVVPVYTWIAMKRIKSGRPIVDEMTKKIGVKATSTAYYLSIFVWPIVFGISDHMNLDNHTTYHMGLIGMLAVGLASVVFYKIRGVKDV